MTYKKQMKYAKASRYSESDSRLLATIVCLSSDPDDLRSVVSVAAYLPVKYAFNGCGGGVGECDTIEF